MADVLVGSERRVLISGYGLHQPVPPPPPPPDSLLGRLDQIDLRVRTPSCSRLRQLEEQRRPAATAEDDGDVHRAPRHHHTKSLPSALQPHVQARGTIMDRLNLLESRIRQLSCELDLDIGAGKAGSHAAAAASSMAPPPVEDPAAWSDTASMMVDPAVAMMSAAPAGRSSAAADGSWTAVDILQRGARQFHRSKSKAPNKVKNLKEGKCACQKEKRKPERSRTNRRWFTVGC
ncbi:hypothetical protein HU200_056430 [Digitaria exilis]|uniref:Uncharacterized protein n=1 Tax=Digitaria exilis TaxID=1010633 RepID=A0A835E2G9_9POAL|nr:hypothetical protein HU200_056430 [Digitaria exilis]